MRAEMVTLFSAFHHFRPDEARKLIAELVQQGKTFALFEYTQRHPLWFLYCLTLPLLVLAATPWMKGLSLNKLLFTDVIPLIPLSVCFDGVITGLRSYSTIELGQLTEELARSGCRIEVGVKRIGWLPIGITCLVAFPQPQAMRSIEKP